MFLTNRTRIATSLAATLLILPFVAAGCGSGSASDTRSRVEKIVFLSNDEGGRGINTISPDGTGRKLVFPADSSLDSPTFSPDGTRIAFLSNREDCGGVGCKSGGNGPDYPSQIWLINADGTGLRQLTRWQDGAETPLSFSRDGARLLYNAYEASGRYSLRSVNPSGGEDTVVMSGKMPDFHGATLSPDGSKVLFVSDRDGDPNVDGRDIYIRNLDGTGEQRLTSNPMADASPSFSPDGSRILFRRNGYQLEAEFKVFRELYVMNADGTGETRLTDNMAYEWAPSFSPDGTKILYTSMGSNGGGERLFVMNADGTDQHPILQADGSKPYLGYIAQHGAWALTPVQ